MRRLLLFGLLLLSGCGQSHATSGGAKSDGAYDRYRRPEALVAALALRRGQSVADVGAGRGYLTFRLAEAVGPSGRVLATDVDPRALDALAGRARAEHVSNISTRMVDSTDPGLEAASFDLVLLAEVDSYLKDRGDYFRRLAGALRPGGRVAISNRVPYRSQVVAAMRSAHFHAIGESKELPGQFLILFEADR